MSILSILKCFSIRPIQNLRKSHKYGYSRIKELYEYEYSKVEKPYEYKYFKIKKSYKYKYPILQRFDGDIQGIYGFQNFYKLRKSCYKYKNKLIIRSKDLAFKAKSNVMICEHIIFCNKKYCYIICITICDMTIGHLKTIYFFFFISRFLFLLSNFLDFI